MVQRIIGLLVKLLSIKTNSQSKVRRTSPLSPYFSSKEVYPFTRDELQQIARKYDGKLLLRDEIHLDDTVFSYFLKLNLFFPVKSIERTLFYARCVRCNNQKRSLLGMFSCARCGKRHFYCRNCIMMGRMMECEPLYEWNGPSYLWPKHENPCSWEGKLTIAQKEAAEGIVETIEKKGEKLIWAVTGAGKTEMLFKGIDYALKRGERICIATPRADVVRELLPRIKRAFRSIQVQGLHGTSRDRERNAQLIISTTHQLFRFRRAFDVIIIDEIDAFPFHNDESLQFAAKRAAKQKSAKIYLTATPRKQFKRKMLLKQLDYTFVPLRYHGHPLPVPTLIYDSSLKKCLAEKQLPSKLSHWLKKRKNNRRQLLIFVPTISLAEELHPAVINLFSQHNLIRNDSEIVSVHAEDPLREEKIEKFRQRKTYVLITTTILERGVTFPSIDVVVLHAGHTVFDEAALVQIAGRAGRNKLDPKGEVVFIHDGQTVAIQQSVAAIEKMNWRGRKLLSHLRSM